MTPYLDVTKPEDLARFPKDLRGANALADTVRDAMSDLLAYYTVPLVKAKGSVDGLFRVGAFAVVCLRGYTVDPAQGDPGTVEAVRRELVYLTRWKLAQADVSLTAKSKSAGGDAGASTTWRDDAVALYPPGFGQTLEPFDAREDVLNGTGTVESGEPLYYI